MKWNLKREAVSLCVLAIFGTLTAYYYPTWPEVVPRHFNLDGIADGFSLKQNFVWMIAGVFVIVYALLTFIPFIDPFWKRIQEKYHLLLLFRDIVMVFLLLIYILNIIAINEGKLRLEYLGVALGTLFLLLGNYLPKLPRNWFFGIRVPWTLSSEVVWKKTHAVGGWWFVAAGAAMIVLSLFGVNQLVVLAVTLLPATLYSALIHPLTLYKKLQREGRLNEVQS